MTTVEEEHKFVVYCEGKSCRQLYFNACERLEMRPNTALLQDLSSKRNIYGMKELELLGQNFLGSKGCLALLDVIRANTGLISLRLANQGADDEFVSHLVQSMSNHQRLEFLDLSGNQRITNAVVPQLFELLRSNQMIHELSLEGSGVARSIQKSLKQKCTENAMLEADFFKGDYAKLKKLFCELDSDGSGSITVTELIAQIEVPQVALALEKRFKSVSQRGDGSFGMEEFLRYIHPKFNSLEQLKEHMEDKFGSDPEQNIVANWELLRGTVAKGRMNFDGYQHVRVTARVLSSEEWIKVLELALAEEWKSNRQKQMSADGRTTIHHSAFVTAVQQYMGAEEEEAERRRGEIWGTIKLPPSMLKMLHSQFIHAVVASNARPAHLITNYENLEVPLGNEDLLQSLSTQTLRLKPRALSRKLKANAIGSSITANFVEWITFLNEQYDMAAYNTYRPVGVDRSTSAMTGATESNAVSPMSFPIGGDGKTPGLLPL